MLFALATVAVLVLSQVAWGFLREDEPSFLAKVQTCLTERATPFEAVSRDPVALSAKRGALRTVVEGNAVTVALGSSENDAERVFETYARIAGAEIVGTRLDRRRKVVFLWDSPPSTAQRDFMYLCTLDAQE